MQNNEAAFLDSLREQAKRLIITGVVLLVMLPLTASIFDGLEAIVGAGCFIAAIVCFIRSAKKAKEYKQYFKKVFVTNMIKEIMPEAEYFPEGGFSKDCIRETGLMMMGNRYHSEDYIKGTYNGVAFERADIYIADESTDSDGNSSTTVYLEGRWMVFETNKSFEADLQIIQKGFGYAKKKKGIFTRKAERRHEIKTEDENFNSHFTCLCQNDTEAFYLLTPGIMQSMETLVSSSNAKFMVGFVDNRIHVAVHTRRDSLEPSIFRKMDFEKERQEIVNEMNAITDFISALKLDRQIFR